MIPLATFRDGLNLQAGDEDDLKLLRATVIKLWESLTKRPWNKETGRVEYHNIGGDTQTVQSLFLELMPVTTITLIEERDADEDWATVDSDEYVQQGRRQIVRKSSTRFRFWKEFVRVTYDGGSDAVDEEIQMALIAQARFMRTRLAKEQITLQSQNFEGGAGVMLRADLHPYFKTLAKTHKRKS
jgi:hypothetical protein